jgi:hypothetical protein
MLQRHQQAQQKIDQRREDREVDAANQERGDELRRRELAQARIRQGQVGAVLCCA